ncbi:MAG: transcription antitermination factor NusB [bacterium]
MIDIRHQNRIDIIKKLFELSFNKKASTEIKEQSPTLKKILKNSKKIEEIIVKHASRYPVDKISKIDLAVLKLSVYELLFEKKNPPKVIINEAVELAKEFGNEKSYSFINGVMGAVLNGETDYEK